MWIIFFHAEKIVSVKLIELFKSWSYRHLRNSVMENLQNFSEQNAWHSEKMIESSTFYSEKFCKFFITLFSKCLYHQILNSSTLLECIQIFIQSSVDNLNKIFSSNNTIIFIKYPVLYKIRSFKFNQFFITSRS